MVTFFVLVGCDIQIQLNHSLYDTFSGFTANMGSSSLILWLFYLFIYLNR